MTKPPVPSPEDLILQMLREVLARQAQQMGLAPEAPPAPMPPPVAPPPPLPTVAPPAMAPAPQPAPPTLFSDLEPAEQAPRALTRAELEALERFEQRAVEPSTPSRVPVVIRYLVVGLVVLLVLINLPLFGGTALARALPDRQALIIRDGLVLKGPGPEIYVIENDEKRWISSLDAFEHYGYSWDLVRVVDQPFLDQFPDGRPLHVLVKCSNSPHVFRLENNTKRWIKDIPTLLSEGHAWEDVRVVDCRWLRELPDGETIPPGAGEVPEI